MNKNALTLLFGMAIIPAGCTMMPEYTRPAAPVPTTFPSGPAYDESAPEAPAAQDLPWQEFITDERLRTVIATALENNRDLRLAALNVERARGLYGIQRAELLPIVDASGRMLRQRVPGDLSRDGKRSTAEQYTVDLGVIAWEIDFFGRIRSLEAAALQQYLATEEAQRATQLVLVSGLVNTYLTLAADRENLKLARTTLEAQQAMYDLVKRRFERGLVPELDVHRAMAQVETARGDSARYTQLVAQDQNALNLLVGSTVPDELLPVDLDGVKPPMDVAVGTPSEVLLGRPDIVEAEHQLMAANANIGAARAAFFPRISLTAAAGTTSADLSGLFQSGSGMWSYSPQIVLPIFDNRLRGAAQVSETDQKIAVARYEQAIQSAFREVADALAVRGTVNQQLSAAESLVRAVAETYRLSDARYTKGVDSYLSVLDAQRSLYGAQQQLVYLRLAKLANQVRLYTVLGGGVRTGVRP
jgi:multidrug efflux system outer membrane protein